MPRFSRRAIAILRADQRFNHALPSGDPRHATHRMVGFIVPCEVAGLSDALFALEEIQVKALEAAGLVRMS